MSNDEYQTKEFFEDKPIETYYDTFHKIWYKDLETYNKYKDSHQLHAELLWEIEYKEIFK